MHFIFGIQYMFGRDDVLHQGLSQEFLKVLKPYQHNRKYTDKFSAKFFPCRPRQKIRL